MDKKRNLLQRYAKDARYVCPKICSQCPNKCCEDSGCMLMPVDIEPFTADHIIQLIDSGQYIITFKIYDYKAVLTSITSREVDDDGVFRIIKPHSTCSLLTENGCKLSTEERPSVALLLVPHANFNCQQLISYNEIIDSWKEQSTIMEEVVKHYSGGKESYSLVLEVFDRVAKRFYHKLMENELFDEYDESVICRYAMQLRINLFDKLMAISDSLDTRAKIINKLVCLYFSEDYIKGRLIAFHIMSIPYYTVTGRDLEMLEGFDKIVDSLMKYSTKLVLSS